MRLSSVTAVAAVLVPIAFTLTPVRALSQQPIRVVRHVPADTIRTGDVITISFDRPVAGSVERSANPERFVRFDPPLRATVQWRDPATIRVIPNERLEPGRRFRITVATDLEAVDGGTLEAAYQFTLEIRGPVLLGSNPPVGSKVYDGIAHLEPNGRMVLVYSAAIDSSLLARTARVEFTPSPGCSGTVRMRPSDPAAYMASNANIVNQIAFGARVDTAFLRLVELTSETRLPESCAGTLFLPSFDSNDKPEIAYKVVTAGRFDLFRASQCEGVCTDSSITLIFSAPVKHEDLVGHVSIVPPTPFKIEPNEHDPRTWTLRLNLVRQKAYRITFDSSLRDIYGRPLGATVATYRLPNREPALGHQLGFFTVPRQRAMLRVTHVNADSVEVAMVPIADSLRSAVIHALSQPESLAKLVATQRDTTWVRLRLAAATNEQRITEVPIPARLLTPESPYPLIAMRARMKRRAIPKKPALVMVNDSTQLLDEVEIISLGSLSNNVALVQVTDLVAYARVNDKAGSVLVTDMNTGEPVRGASVTVRDVSGDTMSSGFTDATGVARVVPNARWRPRAQGVDDRRTQRYWGDTYRDPLHVAFVEVMRGKDRSVTPFLLGRFYYDWNEPSVPGTDPEYTQAMVYAERDIYRPGEKVYLGVIARQGPLSSLRPLDAGDSVRIRVATSYSPNVEVLRDTVVTLNRFGTVADSFTIATGTPLGYYDASVSVMRRGAWRAYGRSYLRIAEYRAPQFRASIDIDSIARHVGDTLPVQVTANYYFGAPMAKATLNWAVSAQPVEDFATRGLPPRFTAARRTYFANQETSEGGNASGQDTLDVTGKRILRLPTDRGSINGPARVSVSVSVTDVDRQSVTTEQAVVMHASDFYIAVRDSGSGWYWQQGQRRTLELLTVRPDGRHVPGVAITAMVIRHHGVFRPATSDAASTWEWVADTISVGSLVSADSIVRFSFTPLQSEWYEARFSARDAAGRSVRTSSDGYVIPKAWAGGWGLDPTALGTKLARDTVVPGDSAVISFVSPFSDAEGWVTVERERILAQRRIRVARGEKRVAFFVDSSFGPTATVSVLLVDASQPMWRTDSTARRFRQGVERLVVDQSSKALEVEIAPFARRYAPGDSARIRVRLLDHRRRPVKGQVTLWAVDESILALTQWTLPDPFAEMYAERWSALTFRSTATMLALLRAQLNPLGWQLNLYGLRAANSVAMLAAVGDRTGGAEFHVAARKDFRSTPFYFPLLATDPNGEVTVSAKLPDNLTSFRLIAVALDSADRFGVGDTSLVITKPLIARSALPRFVRTGDQFRAGAAITNQTGADVAAVVSAAASSASVVGADKTPLALADGRTSEVRFDWRTTALAGDTAVFTLGVSSAANADAVETKLPVRAPYVPRYHAVSGVVRGTETVQMRLPSEIDPEKSKLTLRIGTTPVPAIQSAYDVFRWYPYQCTEQLTSGGRAIVALYRMQRAGLVDSLRAPSSATLRSRLQGLVDELSRRQNDSGSIGYWSRNSWSTTPLSAEAGKLLLDARDIGLDVRQPVVDGLARHIRLQAAANRPTASEFGTKRERAEFLARELARQLAALHYLRRAGAPDTTAEDALLASEGSLAWSDRVWLAELLAGRSDQTHARRLLRNVWQEVAIAGTRVDVPGSEVETYGFFSRVRPAARLLMATLAIEPSHPQLSGVVETVVRQSDNTFSWNWNTQDYASAAEAMARMTLWQRNFKWRDTVVVRSGTDRRTVLLSARAGRDTSTVMSLAGLTKEHDGSVILPMQISGGEAPAYYTLTVEEVPRQPPTSPDEKGIIVERWYERFDDGRPVTEVKEGELVRVRLRITVPSTREFVAISDPLPAGLEPVDLSLRTSSTLGPFESDQSRRAENAGTNANQAANSLYGTWWGGWWSPWEHTEQRDDRVQYFARRLWKGSYTAQYVARATTAGTFIKPPAHAEEMYNQSLGGRSDGGVFRVVRQ